MMDEFSKLKLLYLKAEYDKLSKMIKKSYLILVLSYFSSLGLMLTLMINKDQSNFIYIIALAVNFFTSSKLIESISEMKEVKSVYIKQIKEVSDNGKSNLQI